MNKLAFIVFFLIVSGQQIFSQENIGTLVIKDTVKSAEINPLAPAKAAFYSTILPGAGQAYNKKYWKIPIV